MVEKVSLDFNINEDSDDSVLSLKYPEHTAGAISTSGYFYHHLSAEGLKALHTAQKWVKDHQIDLQLLSKFSLHPDLILLRYIRANNGHVDKAIAHMERNIKWRHEINVDGILSKYPNDNLGCHLSNLIKYLPHWQSGFDKTGRPVLYKQYRDFDASAIKKLTPFENVIKYHVWEQEICMRMCLEQSKKLNTLIETITVVIDVKDMSVRQMSSDFFHLLKILGQVDSAQYPEILGRLFIINAPSAFPLAWRVVKAWLDPVVATKISIYGSQSKWQHDLLDFIGADNTPMNYGGNAPALSTDMHPYSSYMHAFNKDTFEEYWTHGMWKD
eukprot:gene18124-23778_t